MFVKNAWYALAWADEAGQHLLSRTVMNEPILVYRTPDGEAVALEDRCCHRRVPLSLGRLKEGLVECGYHGFTFDCSGKCVRIPNQSHIPPAARVRKYPLSEQYHMLWIWMGDPNSADPALVPDFSILDIPAHAWKGTRMHVKANYRLITDNLSDLSHLTFVHDTTIGNAATAQADIKLDSTDNHVTQTRWMINTPPPPTYVRFAGFDGNIDRWQIVTFRAPSIVTLHTGGKLTGHGAPEGDREGGIGMYNVNAITPETESTSHYFWAQTHDFNIDDPQVTQALFEEIRTAFNQDVVVFEAQQLCIQSAPDAREVSCAADRAQLLTRKIVDRLLGDQPL